MAIINFTIIMEDKMKKILIGTVAAMLFCSVNIANAATLTIPKTFTAGTPAVAADVNANFTAAATSVNDIEGRLVTEEAASTTAAGRLTTLETASTNANTQLTNIEARLAALEAVTATNMAVTPMQKAAGTWGYIADVTWGGQFVTNLVNIGREVIYGNMVINASGAYTMNDAGGHGIDFGLHNNLVFQTVNLPKPDLTSYTFTTAQVVDQKAIITKTSVAAKSGTGTISIGAGNIVSMRGAALGGSVMTGYISQNGQVMVMQGSGAGAESRVFIFTKIQ